MMYRPHRGTAQLNTDKENRPLLRFGKRPKKSEMIFRWLFLGSILAATLVLWTYSFVTNLKKHDQENIIQCIELLFAVGVLALILYLSITNKWGRFMEFASGSGDERARAADGDADALKKRTSDNDRFEVYADHIDFHENDATTRVPLSDLESVSVFEDGIGTCSFIFFTRPDGRVKKRCFYLSDMQPVSGLGFFRKIMTCPVSFAGDDASASDAKERTDRFFTKEKMISIIMPIVSTLFGIGMIVLHHILSEAEPGRTELMPMVYFGIAFAVVGIALTFMLLFPDVSGKRNSFFGGLIFTVFPSMLFLSVANETGTSDPLKVIELVPFTLFFLIFVLFGAIFFLSAIWYMIRSLIDRNALRKMRK
jgi:hypothetical protein